MAYVIKNSQGWEIRAQYLTSVSGASETWGGIEAAMRFPSYSEAREFKNTRMYTRRGTSSIDEAGPLSLTDEERIIETRAVIERTRIPAGELADLQRELTEIGAQREAETMAEIIRFLDEWRSK